ncbi:MAG: hypothetical protein RLP14_05485 [Owenweeksia sp.]
MKLTGGLLFRYEKDLFNAIHYIGAVWLSISLMACKKEPPGKYPPLDHTEVKGVLRDASTLEPIPNGIVKIYKGKCPGAFVIFGDFLEDTTDAQGNFAFTFTHHPDTCYNIVADAELYYGNENKGSGRQYPLATASPQRFVGKGFLNDEDIYLAPYGWLELRIFNERKEYTGIAINGASNTGFNTISFSGQDLDTTVITQQYGNYTNRFPIFVSHPDTSLFKLRNDTFYTPKHDTTYYEIKY